MDAADDGYDQAAEDDEAFWARQAWGSYWNWDPRETSIFFLLLIYAAYLALRSAIDQDERGLRKRFGLGWKLQE